MSNRHSAYVLSALVVVGALVFLVWGWSVSTSWFAGETAEYHGKFSSAIGLARGSDVTIGGIPVGKVSAIHLDAPDAAAEVFFRVGKAYAIPGDSQIVIGSSAMTGGNVLEIRPGKSHEMLAPGSAVANTVSPLSLEQQISNYIFGAGQLSG